MRNDETGLARASTVHVSSARVRHPRSSLNADALLKCRKAVQRWREGRKSLRNSPLVM